MKSTQTSVPKDQRIAIIGAGISGLIAANTLKNLGYNNTTIFEARNRVGGKVCSIEKDGYMYELGAIILMHGSKLLEGLAKEYKFTLTESAKQGAVFSNGEYLSLLKYLRKNYTLPDIMRTISGCIKLALIYNKFKRLKIPGFANADPELYTDLKNLFTKLKAEPFALLTDPVSSAFGYGSIDTTPALYYMKMIQIGVGYAIKDILNSSLGPTFKIIRTFDKGYQNFLYEVSKNFNVRLNSKVSEIKREKTDDSIKVHITVNGKTETFDRVIISSVPHDTMQFLDLDKNEKKIFSRVKFIHFHESIFYGDFPFNNDLLYFDSSFRTGQMGFPGSLHKLHRGNNIFQTYQMHDGSVSKEELTRKLFEMADILKGKIDDVIIVKDFKYFPHFVENDLRKIQPYERLEKMQGNNNTYYIGGLFNFEGTEQTAEYAEYLVNKFFRS